MMIIHNNYLEVPQLYMAKLRLAQLLFHLQPTYFNQEPDGKLLAVLTNQFIFIPCFKMFIVRDSIMGIVKTNKRKIIP